MKTIKNISFFIIILSLIFSENSFSQDSNDKAKSGKKLVIRLSEKDIILPITSIEWGQPDRWSFSSRYIHEFYDKLKRRTWYHNVGLSISPGISGGRIGAGYLGFWDPASPREFALFYELKGTLLRTWGKPLLTSANIYLAGAEIKICISWMLNATIGYYLPIKQSNNSKKAFWGFHLGIGI